ncbi:MAG TPA: HAMP domain-containing histidine kinase [Nannocystis exedens]|nr:HAMP domain-containing histidine kinase [Nannocystis exedens]
MPTPLHIALGLIGVPITVGLAALTGGLVGLVLSRDILGLSRALDRNLDQPNFPLKVTRNDRLGIVQATLEEQRCHLLDTLAQHAEASAQLREANTAKVELVSALNHNLRTSLTTILGHLQLLDTDTDPWIAQHRHELDTLNSLAEGLLHQLRSFVEIAMLASEELRLHLVETDVEELLDRALLDHLDSAATAGLKLVRNRQAEPLPTICADSRRLGQALHILLDHAIELAEPSTISISTGIQELQGVLEISIVFSQREHGAEADLSLPNTRMVLGLELAQAIASGHGGDLLARTNPAGLSTLILTLPLSPERCPSPDLNLPTTGAQERGLSTSPERAA